MSGQERRRQKKLEKHKKRRAAVQKSVRERNAPLSRAALIRSAASASFGPCWMSELSDDETTADFPELVEVVVSRRVRGLFLAQMVLVDRTCLGVKEAFLLPQTTELELIDHVESISGRGAGLYRCEPPVAQAVIYHALDYAASLGFSAHPDFAPELVGPRPEVLFETPLARPARPYYVAGPDDDVEAIVAQLDRAVGRLGYTFVSGGDLPNALNEALDDDFEAGGFDGSDDDEEYDFETEGEEVDADESPSRH